MTPPPIGVAEDGGRAGELFWVRKTAGNFVSIMRGSRDSQWIFEVLTPRSEELSALLSAFQVAANAPDAGIPADSALPASITAAGFTVAMIGVTLGDHATLTFRVTPDAEHRGDVYASFLPTTAVDMEGEGVDVQTPDMGQIKPIWTGEASPENLPSAWDVVVNVDFTAPVDTPVRATWTQLRFTPTSSMAQDTLVPGLWTFEFTPADAATAATPTS